jgi:hypothetical protein
MKNESLIDVLIKENYIRDARIYKFELYENQVESVSIDIYIKLINKKGYSELKLTFTNVVEYSFYYKSDRYFYYIETFKLLKFSDGFYASFDPIDESKIINDEDQDYIKAMSVEGYFIK